jgi:hypothetical protein
MYKVFVIIWCALLIDQPLFILTEGIFILFFSHSVASNTLADEKNAKVTGLKTNECQSVLDFIFLRAIVSNILKERVR